MNEEPILLNATAELSEDGRDLYIDTHLDLPRNIKRLIISGKDNLAYVLYTEDGSMYVEGDEWKM